MVKGLEGMCIFTATAPQDGCRSRATNPQHAHDDVHTTHHYQHTCIFTATAPQPHSPTSPLSYACLTGRTLYCSAGLRGHAAVREPGAVHGTHSSVFLVPPHLPLIDSSASQRSCAVGHAMPAHAWDGIQCSAGKRRLMLDACQEAR